MFRKSKTEVRGLPSWDETGVSALLDTTLVTIPWSEVTAIYAYKKDCLTVDQIRMIIASKDLNIEFIEGDTDFDGLKKFIAIRLTVRRNWYEMLILSPAFETTWTVVYPENSSIEIEVTQ
jgi:hypothetical protein